tara:strand:- start:3035 stop:3229 length:195 start_codon:yes stop_codon:yes gene_type:complete
MEKIKMKVKDLKKDKNKSVRINSEILKILESQGLTLQSFLDSQLDSFISIEIKDSQLATNEKDL